MADTPLTPTGNALVDILSHLSILDDLNGIIHGKGGIDKIEAGLDIVKQIAGAVAVLVPPAAPIAGMIAEGAGVADTMVHLDPTIGSVSTERERP